MGADWQKLWPHFEPLVDRLADVYPKATADALREATADYAPLYTALGPFVALDLDVFALTRVDTITTANVLRMMFSAKGVPPRGRGYRTSPSCSIRADTSR